MQIVGNPFIIFFDVFLAKFQFACTGRRYGAGCWLESTHAPCASLLPPATFFLQSISGKIPVCLHLGDGAGCWPESTHAPCVSLLPLATFFFNLFLAKFQFACTGRRYGAGCWPESTHAPCASLLPPATFFFNLFLAKFRFACTWGTELVAGQSLHMHLVCLYSR